MATAARIIETEPFMPERTILDEKIDHLKEDVAGVRADVKRIDAKADAIGASLTEHRLDTERSFGKLREEIATSFGVMRTEMTAGFGALRLEMKDHFEKYNRDRATQFAWMITTLIAAVGAAFTAAKFFSHP